MAGDLDRRVGEILRAHPRVGAPGRLAGPGTATEYSDWDFRVDAADFPAVAAALPELHVVYPVFFATTIPLVSPCNRDATIHTPAAAKAART